MTSLVWIFPLLFVFHDFEEIIGFGIWEKKNFYKLENRIPRIGLAIKKLYMPYSTEGMALAVLEELLLCTVICLVSILVSMYHIWVGIFIAFIIHLFIHIIQSIIFRGYIPAIITSIILLPISIIVLGKSLDILNYSMKSVIFFSIVGSIIVLFNLKLAHFLLRWFTRKNK